MRVNTRLGVAPSLSFVLLGVLLAILWVAGGASRPDAMGQVVVRATAFGVILALILFGERPDFASTKPVWLLLLAALTLTLVQLVPLPPSIWLSLPGRAAFAEAAVVAGQPQPWRPWSLDPGATMNAATSLIAPIAGLILLNGLRLAERKWLPTALLCMVIASTLIALLQFSGAGLNSPFINDTRGAVSGNFANRNHLALLLAIGCALTPIWMFSKGPRARWRAPVGLGLVMVFALTILASGSRIGMGLGFVAVALGLLQARHDIRKELSWAPKWAFPAFVAGLVVIFAGLILISVAADRAVSIERAFVIDVGQDMRGRALPTLLTMAQTYFPLGIGAGAFDPIFRFHEPHALLKPTYFNHAHNDLLEVIIEAGLLAMVLLAVAIGWAVLASVRAWRHRGTGRNALPKLGSIILLLVVVASAFDYPARTPLIMTVVILAGGCLCYREPATDRSALPTTGRHL